VFFADNAAEIAQINFNQYATVGLIPSASTLEEQIREVINYMTEQNEGTTQCEILNEKCEIVEKEAAKKPKAKVAVEEITTMEQAMKSKHFEGRSYREGMRVKACVMSADASGITVAVEGGGKNDSGFISRDEAELDGVYSPDNYKARRRA
jgi:hypothetical protein